MDLISFSSLGISSVLLGIIMVWSLAWKLGALWKSARNGSLVWFIILGVVNTVGILEILYIFVFSKMSSCKMKEEPKKSISKKKSRKRK